MDILKFYNEFKYPKLILLGISIVIAYLLFRSFWFQHFVQNLGSLSYLGIFIAGMLFSFGFTTPFAIAFFITIDGGVNIFDAALIGGFGALISDMIIFELIRFDFMDEFTRIRHFHIFKTFNNVFTKSISFRIRTYITLVLAGIIIASPLPDEIGVAMLAGFTEVNRKIFATISYIFNTLGIFLIIFLSSL